MITSAIELPMTAITESCQRWQITEFSLFGSVLREDFRPDSDIDILVTFAPDTKRGLTETLQMQDELKTSKSASEISPHRAFNSTVIVSHD